MTQNNSRLSSIFPTKTSKAIFSVFLIALLTLSAFFVLYTPKADVAASEPQSLGVSVSPSGSSFQLGVNDSRTFVASALNGSAPFNYLWSLNPTGNFTFSVNGVTQEVSNASVLKVSGQNLTLVYPVAVADQFVSVSVAVVDSKGVSGQSQVFVVADPYTSPGYKFDASTASASQIVTADGLGWFRVVKGIDGSVISSLSSTNPSTTINGALALGGLTFINNGAYTGASLVVPATATLVTAPQVTGITYASIASGARVDEPTFNTCFGGYSSGSYTIVTGSSAVTGGATWYLAFNPSNVISWSSTNFATVFNTATNLGGKIILAGSSFTTNDPLWINHTNTYVEGLGENLTAVNAGSSFSLSKDLLTIADGVNYVGVSGLLLDGKNYANSSILHIQTPSNGVGHTSINLDGVYLSGVGNSTNYILQVDSLGFSVWGKVHISGGAYNFQWQAANHAATSFLANSEVNYLKIEQNGATVVNGVKLSNVGFLKFNHLTVAASDLTSGTGILVDNSVTIDLGLIDVEQVLNGVVLQGGAGYTASVSAGQGSYVAAKNGISFSGNCYANTFTGVVFDPSGTSGGVGVADSSDASSPVNSQPNQIINAVLKTYSTMYTVTNAGRLNFVGTTGVNFLGASVASPPAAAAANGTWQINPYPFTVTLYIYGGSFAAIKINQNQGVLVWAAGGVGYPNAAATGVALTLPAGIGWLWDQQPSGTTPTVTWYGT